MTNNQRPLKVTIDGGNMLVIRIGIKTLAHAFERAEHNNPHDEATGEFRRQLTVTDPHKFAYDVRLALLDESEDGNTLLTKLLDAACIAAAEGGSCGISEPTP